MNTSHVILITELGSVTCGTIADLSRSIAESLPIGQDQVACIVRSPQGSRISDLSFTYCRNGSMFETYGSRHALDFGLLLSRIRWDRKQSKLNQRLTCCIKGCRPPYTNTSEEYCIRCHRSNREYISGNIIRRVLFSAKGYVQA